MIHLITGIPGSGKTLLAVELIVENMKSASIRPLYTNISGLKFNDLRCFELEKPEEWFNLPDGSIIVIDECQRWFRPRPNGSAVPEMISRFETHRHQGHDIILITQNPRLIDSNIRKLVELHQHMYRPFGLQSRTVMEWTTCNESPEPAQSESSSLKTKKAFDTKLFSYYQSATVHTHQRRLPWKKIYLMAGSVIFVAGCAYKFISGKVEDIEQARSHGTETSVTDTASKPGVIAASPEQEETEVEENFVFRGFERTGTNITIYFENTASGKLFTLADFEGYSKSGALTELFVESSAGRKTYQIFDSELASLLP
ncbi:AAA family ATPase [Rheinheimera riviphila]|uniref:AAA family ATPase n=1 Tax=Rheinheimera riviphila TaxID=1834037 RepID=A0A437QFC8_9GAMM|nr:zonular occludens toxin domain-containing protein [Rheinheimera riviphila]RVU33235.1 AAA family ATPase [Rheinheimera riviphila]